MMNWDQNSIFERWMNDARKKESEGKFNLAKSQYKDAYDLAVSCDDTASMRAQEGLFRCSQRINRNRNNEVER